MGDFWANLKFRKFISKTFLNRRSSAPFGSFAIAKARAGLRIITAFVIAITLAILAAIDGVAFMRISAVLVD